MRLKDRVALITGGSIGIGRAESYLFASEGAKIAVADINDIGGEATAAYVNSNASQARYFHADVTKAAEVSDLIDKVIKQFGQIDILVNDVGIPQRLTKIEDTSEALWDQVHAVNLKSVFFLTKYVIPHMKKANKGVILNTSTMNAIKPHALHCAITSAKNSVIAVTRAFARELAPNNIRVNCISPWTIDTPSFRESLTEEQQKEWLAEIPLGRIGKPEDIANAALFLVSDDASWFSLIIGTISWRYISSLFSFTSSLIISEICPPDFLLISPIDSLINPFVQSGIVLPAEYIVIPVLSVI